MKKILMTGLLIIGISSALNAQNPYPGETDLERQKRIDARNSEIVNSIGIRNGRNATRSMSDEMASRVRTIALGQGKYKKIKREITKENAEYITPNPTDFRKYERFLVQKDTGLIKLLPDIGCKKILVIDVSSPCVINATIPGDGAAYSFRTVKYDEIELSDLWLKDGKFKTGGFLTQGILVKLNDSIENASLNSEGMNYLNTFTPSKDAKGMQAQKSILDKGIKKENFVYSSEHRIVENATYALRSIAYRGTTLLDERFDITVVFSVVRTDNDGAATVVWKILKKEKSPKIKKSELSYVHSVYNPK